MSQNPNLLPERHPDHDLFICDVSDAVLKDVMQHMEHPFFSLSKKPDLRKRTYEHNGVTVTVTPSVNGLATIYDKDILIYCISQVMAKLRRGEKVSRRVKIHSYDLLVFSNRGTSGRDYMALVDALDRLEGTRIRTNVVTGDIEQTEGFGLIDATSVERTHGMDGRLLSVEVTLSDWVFNAIRHNEVLTLHRDYFRLRKPTERRLYELARKHCGSQSEWRVSLALLLKKTGARTTLDKFRWSVRELVRDNHLPDYRVSFDAEKDQVIFTNRYTMPDLVEDEFGPWTGPLDPSVYDQVREVAPGWDVYMLEREWRRWVGLNEINPRYPERHFLQFGKSWAEKKGPAS